MSRVFFKKPNYIIPTYRATEKALEISNEKFGKQHHLNNKANAFRHAIWNYLLCQSYFKISGSIETAVKRSKEITDLHEDLLPNKHAARLMDLHNNKIGRNLFSKDQQMNIELTLETMMKDARKFQPDSDIEQLNGYLVFLED